MATRLASAALAALLLSSCDRPSAVTKAAAVQQLTAKPPAVQQLTAGPTQLDPVTALTVVSTGLDVATKVKSLFGKPDNGSAERSTKEILAGIATLQHQNTQIIQHLAEALDILRNLGVTIRAGVRDELVVQQKVALGAKLQFFYETWSAEINDPSRATRYQAHERYQVQIGPTIHDLGRQLASSATYGYAHFETVGQAMPVEIWISRRLGERASFRREAAAFYRSYFSEVLSDSINGSVAFQLAEARRQATRMDSVLDAADRRIARDPTFIAQRDVLVDWSSHGSRCSWKDYVDIQHTLSGNRQDGYRVTPKQVNPRRVPPTCTTEGGGTGNDHGHPLFQQLYGVAAEPEAAGKQPPSFVASTDDQVAAWNTAATVRKRTEQDIAVLEKARDTAKAYLALAEETYRQP